MKQISISWETNEEDFGTLGKERAESMSSGRGLKQNWIFREKNDPVFGLLREKLHAFGKRNDVDLSNLGDKKNQSRHIHSRMKRFHALLEGSEANLV